LLAFDHTVASPQIRDRKPFGANDGLNRRKGVGAGEPGREGDSPTARNIKEDLTDVLYVRQGLGGTQPFLGDNLEGTPFVL